VLLAAGSGCITSGRHAVCLESGAIVPIRPETTRLGCITELKKVSALAEASGIRIAPPDGSAGPIVEMANAHMMATTPAILYLERKDDDVPWRYKVVKVCCGGERWPDPGSGCIGARDRV